MTSVVKVAFDEIDVKFYFLKQKSVDRLLHTHILQKLFSKLLRI